MRGRLNRALIEPLVEPQENLMNILKLLYVEGEEEARVSGAKGVCGRLNRALLEPLLEPVLEPQ
jgi:hypothetical protein